MNTVYGFLNMYKELEDLLEARMEKRGDSRRGSVVVDYMNSAEGEPYRDRLNLCREIRNLLTHNADLDQEPVVMPSNAVFESLAEIIEALKKPRMAMEFATPYCDLLIAHYDTPVTSLMLKMEERGISHVPVIGKGGFCGVFSVSTIFSACLRADKFAAIGHACVGDFEELLPPEKHLTEQFRFLCADALITEACRMFETSKRTHEKRVAAVFLTKKGEAHGRLEGVITPWDIVKYRERSNE